MTIWEKAVLNIQQGARRVSATAAVFSERVRVELDVVRLRIRMDEVRTRADELYKTVGRRFVQLHKKDELPKTSEQLLKDEEIVAAVVELADREQELAELNERIKNAWDDVRTTKQAEDQKR